MDCRISKFSIGQQVRIVNYDHPHCGEFGRVLSVPGDGKSAIVKLMRFHGRHVAVTVEQVVCARPMTFQSQEKPMEPTCVCGHVRDEHDGNVCTIEGCSCVHFETEDDIDNNLSTDNELPAHSQASHYS